ncbi:MAG: DUF3868 domain-containing protein [Proteiniphilum sp.]|jgi:outer membrane protein OmpA-like peptidoglycan-associated protein|nr:DUF3868 domain-containing protein [Proteiniphilum sp.]
MNKKDSGMKTNNRKYKYGIVFTLYLLGWALFSPASAQEYNGRINVKPKLSLIDDSLYIDMTVTLEGVPIDNERSLTLTPVLTGESRTKQLTPLIINGSRRHQLYLRYLALNKGVDYPVAVKRGDKTAYAREVAYHTAVRYEQWMGDASLDLVEDLCGCAGNTQKISVERLVAMIVPPESKIEPLLAYIHPDVEAEKMRDEQADIFLDFKVAETVILPNFMSNRKELDKAENLLRELQDDRNVSITGITIRGFASPEGEEEMNKRLGVGRANALNQYLSQRFVIPRSIYSVEPVGEDWVGFEKLMEESDLFSENYRADVLEIIRSNAPNDDKQTAIVALKSGSYDMILKNIYSRLRRVVCRVDYRVRAFNLEEAKELYFSKPQQLSLDELFRVANTYDDSDPQFGEIFETAVRLFPEDQTANLNAAASSLIHGNTQRAKRYLERSDKTTAEYMNNRGVYELLSENYEEARVWLEKARSNGSKLAEHNLAELDKKVATL